MYVIKSGSTGRLFPADRCSWEIVEASGGGYEVRVGANEAAGVALFYDGTDDNGSVIPGATSSSTRPVFGYIGKTGRFVAMTNE